jgi:hypothetical protein
MPLFPRLIWSQIAEYLDASGLCRLSLTSTSMRDRLQNLSTCWKKKTLCDFQYFSHNMNCSWFQTYRSIVSGEYSGLIHVLNSLANREMSAFLAIATYSFSTKSYLVSYQPNYIARYRAGDMILINQNHEAFDEAIQRSDYLRLRRVPAELMNEDPRALYSRALFELPLTSDGRPALLPGEEVEVQWKPTRNSEYGWWRGFVITSFNVETFNTNSSIHLPNDIISPGDTEGALILFNHFPPDSSWRHFLCSLLGQEKESALGYVGGIRLVKSSSDSKQWQDLFPISEASALRSHSLPS